MQTFDRIGRSDRFPLLLRKATEGEESIAGFPQAIGYRSALQPPLANEGSAALGNLLLGSA